MLWEYCRAHVKSLLLFAVFAGIFAIVFFLFSLPVEAVLYAAVLCAAVGLAVGAIDFRAFCRKHALLVHVAREIADTVDSLPQGGNLLERDYQNLICSVHQNRTDLVSKADTAYRDMVDYYTLWAHQIKTPIAAMRLLLQEQHTPENAEISAELFKIEQYVEMVLAFLRTDSSTTDYVIKSYDLDAILRAAIRKYAPQFIRKKIRLVYEQVHCRVLTDAKWLQFIIEQVISNAIKYTDGGTIAIAMGENCVLSIADTGMGIAAEDLPRIFEKGFTGYNGRVDKKSTGIGLYLCRRVADKLSHSMQVLSEEGRGTTVRIGLGSQKIEVE